MKKLICFLPCRFTTNLTYSSIFVRCIKYYLCICAYNTCFATTQTQLEYQEDFPLSSPQTTVRLVLRLASTEKPVSEQAESSAAISGTEISPMHQLISLIDTLRHELDSQRIEDADSLLSWVETNIDERVRVYIENNPLIGQQLVENRRIELRLYPLNPASDENPIMMIVDSWGRQTTQEAIMSSILYPASIPMLGDECNHQNRQHLMRLALCAYYRNPLAYHHLALWAQHHRPEAYGVARGRKPSSQERLFIDAMKQFEISFSAVNIDKYSDFQRRSLILCMRNLKPETTKRTPVELTEDPETQDPRLLFNMGISGTKHGDKLVKSRKSGFLTARFHHTRRLKKQERKEELQKLKRDLSIFERRTRMRNTGGDLLAHIASEVDNDLVCVGVNPQQDPIPVNSKAIGFTDEQTKDIADQALKIINKNK